MKQRKEWRRKKRDDDGRYITNDTLTMETMNETEEEGKERKKWRRKTKNGDEEGDDEEEMETKNGKKEMENMTEEVVNSILEEKLSYLVKHYDNMSKGQGCCAPTMSSAPAPPRPAMQAAPTQESQERRNARDYFPPCSIDEKEDAPARARASMVHHPVTTPFSIARDEKREADEMMPSLESLCERIRLVTELLSSGPARVLSRTKSKNGTSTSTMSSRSWRTQQVDKVSAASLEHDALCGTNGAVCGTGGEKKNASHAAHTSWEHGNNKCHHVDMKEESGGVINGHHVGSISSKIMGEKQLVCEQHGQAYTREPSVGFRVAQKRAKLKDKSTSYTSPLTPNLNFTTLCSEYTRLHLHMCQGCEKLRPMDDNTRPCALCAKHMCTHCTLKHECELCGCVDTHVICPSCLQRDIMHKVCRYVLKICEVCKQDVCGPVCFRVHRCIGR